MRADGRGEVVLLLRKRGRARFEPGPDEADRRALDEEAVLGIAAANHKLYTVEEDKKGLPVVKAHRAIWKYDHKIFKPLFHQDKSYPRLCVLY